MGGFEGYKQDMGDRVVKYDPWYHVRINKLIDGKKYPMSRTED